MPPRCMKSEKQGHCCVLRLNGLRGRHRLIWAAAGRSPYVTGGLNTGLAGARAMGPSKAIGAVFGSPRPWALLFPAGRSVLSSAPSTPARPRLFRSSGPLADWFKIDQTSYAKPPEACKAWRWCFPGIGNAPGFINNWHRDLALLQLDQPDAGHDRSVGCIHVLVQGEEEELLDPMPCPHFMSGLTHFILAPECLAKPAERR